MGSKRDVGVDEAAVVVVVGAPDREGGDCRRDIDDDYGDRSSTFAEFIHHAAVGNVEDGEDREEHPGSGVQR